MNGLNENMVLDVCLCVSVRVFSHLSTIYCPIGREKRRKRRKSMCAHARTLARRKIHNDVKHLKAINRMYYSNLMFSLILAHTHFGPRCFIYKSIDARTWSKTIRLPHSCVPFIDYVLSVSLTLFAYSTNTTSIWNRQYSSIRLILIMSNQWFNRNSLFTFHCDFFGVVVLFLLAEWTISANIHTSIRAATKYISAFEITLSSYPMCFHFVESVHVYILRLCLCVFSSHLISSPCRAWFGCSRTLYFDCLCIHTYCIKSTIGIEMRWCQKLMFFSRKSWWTDFGFCNPSINFTELDLNFSLFSSLCACIADIECAIQTQR